MSDAAHKLAGIAAPAPRSKPAPAAGSASSASSGAKAAGGSGASAEEDGAARRDSIRRPSDHVYAAAEAGVHFGATGTGGGGGGSGGGTGKSTDIATKVLATLRLEEPEIAEPEYFARTRKHKEFRDSLAAQVAEHEVARLIEKKVSAAFGSAGTEIVKRSEAAERAITDKLKEKTLKNAADQRAYMKEAAEWRAKEKARILAEEEAFLARMKTELEAELAHAAYLRQKEREGIASSVAENERLKVIREEMRRKAVEEEKRLQAERFEAEVAKERAHKDKYKHIAEKQEILAQQLLGATAAFRERDERLARISEEYAEAKVRADMADAERRKAALKARMQEQVEVLKAMMAEKRAAKDAARDEDRAMAIAGREAVLALREERKEDFKKATEKKAQYSRTLADQLREKMEMTATGSGAAALSLSGSGGGGASRGGGSASAENRAFILKTKSSDLDTEMAFRRQVQLLEKGPATRYNNSEALGPLVGFGAPTSVAIEEAGKAAAAPEEPVVLEAAKAHPLAVIRPKTTFIPAPGTGATSLSLGAMKATAGKR